MPDGKVSFGRVVVMNGLNLQVNKIIRDVISVFQEHDVIKITNEKVKQIKTEYILQILPIYSCLTINLMKKYLTTEGNFINVMQ